VDYVVIEYKFDTSALGKTADGKQMSDSWLSGNATGYNRILESVNDDIAVANKISKAMNEGRVEKWVVRTKVDGSTEIRVVDASGNYKNIDHSKILPERK
jgi:filamentous hemagglutinin